VVFCQLLLVYIGHEIAAVYASDLIATSELANLHGAIFPSVQGKDCRHQKSVCCKAHGCGQC